MSSLLQCDLDETNRYKVLRYLSVVQYPFQIRYSSSGRFHLRYLLHESPLLRHFDEARRSWMGSLGFTLLFDVKRGKRASSWRTIRDVLDLMNFLY